MTIHAVSGIEAWGKLYLCIVKSSKELTQKIGPIPPRLPRIISYNNVLPRKGESVGAWNNYVEVSNLSVAVEGQSFLRQVLRSYRERRNSGCEGIGGSHGEAQHAFLDGTITGILTDAIGCIRELALEGRRISLDGLVSIGLSITHKMGAETADSFSIAKNVDKVKLSAIGVGEFASSILTSQAKLSESKSYQSPRTGSTASEDPENPGTDPDGGGEVVDPGSGSGSDSGSGDTGGSDSGGGSIPGQGGGIYE